MIFISLIHPPKKECFRTIQKSCFQNKSFLKTNLVHFHCRIRLLATTCCWADGALPVFAAHCHTGINAHMSASRPAIHLQVQCLRVSKDSSRPRWPTHLHEECPAHSRPWSPPSDPNTLCSLLPATLHSALCKSICPFMKTNLSPLI